MQLTNHNTQLRNELKEDFKYLCKLIKADPESEMLLDISNVYYQRRTSKLLLYCKLYNTIEVYGKMTQKEIENTHNIIKKETKRLEHRLIDYYEQEGIEYTNAIYRISTSHPYQNRNVYQNCNEY